MPKLGRFLSGLIVANTELQNKQNLPTVFGSGFSYNPHYSFVAKRTARQHGAVVLLVRPLLPQRLQLRLQQRQPRLQPVHRHVGPALPRAVVHTRRRRRGLRDFTGVRSARHRVVQRQQKLAVTILGAGQQLTAGSLERKATKQRLEVSAVCSTATG